MRIYSSEVIKIKLNRRKKMQEVMKVISNVFLVLIILFASYSIYQKFVKRQNNITFFGLMPYMVLSGSMEPTIKKGDIIMVKTVQESQIANNDVVTFLDEDGNIITHRIVDVIIKDGKTYYQTKGDNNNSNDPYLITMKNIMGKYQDFKFDNAGYFIKSLINPINLGLFISIFIIIFVVKSRNDDRKNARHLIHLKHHKNKMKLKSNGGTDEI